MRKHAPTVSFVGLCALLAFAQNASAAFVSYNANGVSGNAPQWNASTWDFDCTPLPAIRGAGLTPGGGTNQFGAIGVATTPTLNTANNDYVRFGFTLNNSPSAEVLVTGFRASVSSNGATSTGMQYQLWAYLPDAGQQLVAVSPAAAMNAPGVNTPINLTLTNGSLIALPNQTIELRLYFWGASGTPNTIGFTNADGDAGTPDVEIFAIPIPAPGSVVVCAACVLTAAGRRRRA